MQLAAGDSHTLLLTSQQRLLVCGNNSCGQLGLGYAGNNQPGFVSHPLFEKQTLPVEPPLFDLPPMEDEAQEEQTEESSNCYLC